MENDFQKIIFQQVLDFFKPIIDTQGDPQEIIRLFEDCGWDMGSVLGGNEDNFVANIAGIIVVIDRVKEVIEDPPDSLQELIGALGNVAPLFEGIIRIADSAVISTISQAPRINELPEDAVNLLFARYLYLKSPFLYRFLELTGVLAYKAAEVVLLNGVIIHYPYKSIHFYFESLGELFSNPSDYFKEMYWPNGIPDVNEANQVAQRLFPKIANLLATLDVNAFNGRGIGPEILSPEEEDRLKGLMTLMFPYYIAETSTTGSINISLGLIPENEQGPGLFVVPSGNLQLVVPFDNWNLNIGASAQIDGFSITQNGFAVYQGAGNLNQFSTDISLEKASTETEKALLIGSAASTRFEIGTIAFGGGVSVTAVNQEFKVFVDLADCALVIAGSEGDSFLNNLLGDEGITVGFDLVVSWSNIAGFHIEGSGSLEISLPTHISLGPIEIQNATIALRPGNNELPLDLSATFKGSLGPIEVVIENMGLRLITTFPSSGGNIGPIDLQAGFKPPNGLGLSINAGAVIGGGYLFFDFEKEEYAGVLELTISGFISAKAIGLITTKMPDGSKGFSMLIIITAEFNPPFQLGYGFTLIGVGGLLGLNRTVLLDPLREGVRTGAVNSIMFPQNVVANATRIISDLKRIFPPYEGKFLIGPMAKLGWGTPTLISLSLGLIIEIPGNLAILGVLKIALPEERAALVQINIAFVGTIDFEKKMLTFDASLYESFILTFTLEGDMAVRLKWGENPDFLLSVGGFHPAYTPPPMALPTLRRLAINILNTDIARIRVECYQAVTSNTVQFGARAEIFLDLRACAISGHIAFDALFQFSPFYFIIELSAGFSLTVAGLDLLSVRVRMSLEGPTPWRARGTGSVSLLFFEVSAEFDKTWGEPANTTLPEIEILPRLIEELNKREQWSTVLSADKNLLVSLRKMPVTDSPPLVLHPAGSLVVQQKLLPLTVKIDQVGNQKTSDIRKAMISGATSAGLPLIISHVEESFARAQYQTLTDAEKLSTPSFEKMPGGVSITLGANSTKNGKMVRKKVQYELMMVDKVPEKPLQQGVFFLQTGVLFANFLQGNSIAKSVLSKSHTEKLGAHKEKLKVLEEGYTVAFQANNKSINHNATFASEMMAQTYLQEQISREPALKKEIHVIPNYEVQVL